MFTITTAWEKVKPSCTTRHTQTVIHRILGCLIKSLGCGKLEVSCVLLGPHCNWNSVAVTSTAVELLYYWVYFARKELWWWLLNSSPRIIEPGLTKGPRAHAMWLRQQHRPTGIMLSRYRQLDKSQRLECINSLQRPELSLLVNNELMRNSAQV